MKNVRISNKAKAILLSGIVLVGSYVGIANAKSDDCYLESTPIAEFLEDEDIRSLTTVDEEIEAGNISIIEKDEEFRKKIIDLNYYASSGETGLYNETLNWLRSHIKDTSLELLFDSTKGAIADEEEVSMNAITLTPGADWNEDYLFLTPEGVAEIRTGAYSKGYTIKSKQLNSAINLIAEIQDMDFSEMSAKDIVRFYDEVTEMAEMTMASGASRHDNKIEEKNSKKYIKKNFNI